jgi:hypothetical protein
MVQHRAAVKMRTARVVPARVCQLTLARDGDPDLDRD